MMAETLDEKDAHGDERRAKHVREMCLIGTVIFVAYAVLIFLLIGWATIHDMAYDSMAETPEIHVVTVRLGNPPTDGTPSMLLFTAPTLPWMTYALWHYPTAQAAVKVLTASCTTFTTLADANDPSAALTTFFLFTREDAARLRDSLFLESAADQEDPEASEPPGRPGQQRDELVASYDFPSRLNVAVKDAQRGGVVDAMSEQFDVIDSGDGYTYTLQKTPRQRLTAAAR